jgi:hypothetical protein
MRVGHNLTVAVVFRVMAAANLRSKIERSIASPMAVMGSTSLVWSGALGQAARALSIDNFNQPPKSTRQRP